MALGCHPAIYHDDVQLQGFANFNSYLGAWRYRPDELESCYVIEAVRGARVILDVGANYGLLSLMMARHAEQALIYAFEPVPATFRAFEKNIKINSAWNILSVQSAVGSEVGVVGFTDTDDPATNRMDRGPDARIQVPITTLDKFCEVSQINTIDFLKIDVEGFELDVLSGASQLFAEGLVKKGLIEICPGNLDVVGVDCASIFDFFESWGYHMFWLDKPGRFLKRRDFEELAQPFLANAGFATRTAN